jgi:hypothetical protein
MGASSPDGTAEVFPEKWEREPKNRLRGIQPSLRDFWDIESEPGSELPGYFQISLREKRNALPHPWLSVFTFMLNKFKYLRFKYRLLLGFPGLFKGKDV